MSFVVSESEAGTGLKRAFPKQVVENVSVQTRLRPSKEQFEFARTVEAELGYSGIRQRAEQQQQEDERARSTPQNLEVVLDALKSIGAPAPFTEQSVVRYKLAKEAKNYAANCAKVIVDVALIVVLFSPILIAREFLLTARESRDSTLALRASAVFWGLIIGSGAWLAGYGVLAGFYALVLLGLDLKPVQVPLPLYQLVLASLLSGVAQRALHRLSFERSVKRSFLDRTWREWRTHKLEGYTANVPDRVLQNALSIKQALAARGLIAGFEVQEFSLVERAWLVDPFLILKVEDVKLYVDWWNETEFTPEYMY
jgi:hypothetical protein